MRVTADWAQITIKQYEDGQFEVYEALSDTNRSFGNWANVKAGVSALLDEIESEFPVKGDWKHASSQLTH